MQTALLILLVLVVAIDLVIVGVMARILILRRALMRIDAHQTIMQDNNTIRGGLTYEEIEETGVFIRRHTVEDGIERIVYTPKNKKYQTPLLFLHGMWHGAWCWQWWQELFAEWGWESHAFSLPGHGLSPEQRPIPQCTLDYYASFLKAEMGRFDSPPVLLGHSMGGAITQWYLKYVRDDLPAVVLVASWVSHAAMVDGFKQFVKVDPLGTLVLTAIAGNATPYIRSPKVAARKLISQGALLTPEELHARLGPESALVTIQHNPPMWKPKDTVQAPVLYLAGNLDAVLSNSASRKTAEHYGADFIIIEKTAHNLMMEHNYRETAEKIHAWLVVKGIA